MSNVKVFATIGIVAAVMMIGRPAVADGNAERGSKAFRICAACHSVEKGDHRTGPSLATIWGQKAGTVDGFRRYSKALKGASVVWNKKTLNQWLTKPKALIPGNRMVFSGMKNSGDRANLIAYLKNVSDGRVKMAGKKRGGMRGGMMGGGQGPLNLKRLGPNNLVKSITHCADTYDVTTENGEIHQFWEFNIRLKTDSSKNGPKKGTPTLIPAGMRGDRASIIFTSPDDISVFIKQQCKK